MAIDVIMPQMGADMTEGTLVKWLKQVGEQVNRGDVLAEIETDKATVELEAFESGVLLKYVVPEGETVPVGQVIALLGTAGEATAEDTPRMARPATAERKSSASATATLAPPPGRVAGAAQPPSKASKSRVATAAQARILGLSRFIMTMLPKKQR